jgi:hypothetical protein
MTNQYGTELVPEQWGLCSMPVHSQGGAGLVVSACDRPASFVTVDVDGDGNHRRYCRECAKHV